MAFAIQNRHDATWWAGGARGWVSDADAALTFESHLEAALITLGECGPSPEMYMIECTNGTVHRDYPAKAIAPQSPSQRG